MNPYVTIGEATAPHFPDSMQIGFVSRSHIPEMQGLRTVTGIGSEFPAIPEGTVHATNGGHRPGTRE
jgi:hypothetical protein